MLFYFFLFIIYYLLYLLVFKNNLQSEDAYFEALMELKIIKLVQFCIFFIFNQYVANLFIFIIFYIFINSNDIVKNNSDKKRKMLEKKKVNVLKKVESFESKLNILETHRWNPMDFKYSSYLTNYCINQLNIIIDKLRNERNEYSFKTAYLYDHTHKGK